MGRPHRIRRRDFLAGSAASLLAAPFVRLLTALTRDEKVAEEESNEEAGD